MGLPPIFTLILLGFSLTKTIHFRVPPFQETPICIRGVGIDVPLCFTSPNYIKRGYKKPPTDMAVVVMCLTNPRKGTSIPTPVYIEGEKEV